MNGDITRSTFSQEKHYSGVRMQQGRVQLDADWNEQLDITAHRIEAEAADVIGGCGGPLHAAGFALTPGPVAVPTIGKGRYYVNGILCENEAEGLTLTTQPDLPVAGLGGLIKPVSATVQDGLYIAYLDVWQRHITALEDERIREVALGGPDTATRTRTIWQVRLLGPLPAPLTCASDPAAWQALLDTAGNGKLSARAAASETTPGPCIVPAGAGYRRLENQLYRVEVHGVNGAGAATLLKWSRDNGAIVTRWLDQQASKPEELIVASVGRDEVLRFAPGQYVELSDDQRELRGEAGILVRLANAEGQVLTLDTADPNAATVAIADFPDPLGGARNNRKARRWDGVVANPAANTWIELEDGVQIRLGPGTYHVGDYWLIPARTATGDVEWPRTNATPPAPIAQARAGVEHHYCKLAILEHSAAGFTVVQDCRNLFPPLTELVSLLYVGGDGQEAAAGAALPQPLRVRVVNGQAPVFGALVRFSLLAGGGALAAAQPVVTVGPDGIAACGWTLGAAGPQEVEAELLGPAGDPVPGQVLRFGATVSLAQGGGCCVCVGPGGDYELLADALKDLIARGERDICICLRPGEHVVNGIEVQARPEEPELHIKIGGCGQGSRLIVFEPIRFRGVRSVLFHDLAAEAAFVVEGGRGVVEFEGCASVGLRACHLSGVTAFEVNDNQELKTWGTLLVIADADRVRLEGNAFEALLPNSLQLTATLFRVVAERTGLDAAKSIVDLLSMDALRRSEFREAAFRSARLLAELDEQGRKQFSTELAAALRQPIGGQRTIWSQGETLSFAKLSLALQRPGITPALALGLLIDIRRATGKARPGTAIVLERPRILEEGDLDDLLGVVDTIDEDDLYIVERNDIAGVLSLYGPPAPQVAVDNLLNADIMGLLRRRFEAGQLSFNSFYLGSLQLSGNQLVRVTVAVELLRALNRLTQEDGRGLYFDLFSRCQWADNVFEGGQSVLVCRHLTLHAGEFTRMAMPGNESLVGTCVVDAAIYLANRSTGEAQLLNASRLLDRVANQQLSIG
jgi:hypothetical protein